jgi:hypothetical protein
MPAATLPTCSPPLILLLRLLKPVAPPLLRPLLMLSTLLAALAAALTKWLKLLMLSLELPQPVMPAQLRM